jgi:hypothetical protein
VSSYRLASSVRCAPSRSHSLLQWTASQSRQYVRPGSHVLTPFFPVLDETLCFEKVSRPRTCGLMSWILCLLQKRRRRYTSRHPLNWACRGLLLEELRSKPTHKLIEVHISYDVSLLPDVGWRRTAPGRESALHTLVLRISYLVPDTARPNGAVLVCQ